MVKLLAKDVIETYKNLCKIYIVPLDIMIITYSIQIQTMWLWLKTKLAIKYESKQFHIVPFKKDTIIANDKPQYKVLNFLYLTGKVEFMDILEYLERHHVLMSHHCFIDLLVITINDKTIDELRRKYHLSTDVVNICIHLKNNEEIMKEWNLHKVSVEEEYNTIKNLIY